MSAAFSRAAMAARPGKNAAAVCPARQVGSDSRVSPSKPKLVMAIVQSDEGGASDIRDIHSRRGGVFRSEDGGEKWTRMSDINPRPFYFSQIRIDPANDQRVYVLGMAVLVSDEGGKNFREDLSEKVHPGLSCARHSAGHDARAESAQTRRQKQAAEAAGLPAAPPRNRRRRLSKLRGGQGVGASQSFSGRRILPHLARRLAAVLPDRRRITG